MGNGASPANPLALGPVHPHAYGERNPGRSADPLTSRFIPTHMGNGSGAGAGSALAAVHPHAYGERQRTSTATGAPRGSSPRIWGTGWPQWGQSKLSRFIPTHMGNGYMPYQSSDYQAVHPHAYGERFHGALEQHQTDGSSPRIWGTGDFWAAGRGAHRFIPTHMGNGASTIEGQCQTPVHPHAYGERDPAKDTADTTYGSSPRIWGTGNRRPQLVMAVRFIPTHMGNGTLRGAASSAPSCGSSPRIWGTDPTRFVRTERERFIPTHMGNGPA